MSQSPVLPSPHRLHRALCHSLSQVKFDSPVAIQRIQIISDGASMGGGNTAQPPPILRIYARDSYTLSASRFATLCPNTITCDEAITTVKTEGGESGKDT